MKKQRAVPGNGEKAGLETRGIPAVVRLVRDRVRRILRRDSHYYTDAYRKADLETNYWSIVGPASEAEFTNLGASKREFLTAQGLTPSSRILDVGCGTGLLAAALEDYLAPGGTYVGTDIAQEAVEYCQRKFRRPNFRFFRNAMTGVSTDAGVFDLIFFGSVFTHMYPDEIVAMLSDVGRLLDADGTVIADAFFRPGIGKSQGDRGLVVIDEEVLLEGFRAAGYAHDTLQEFESIPGVKRGIFRLSRT